MFGSEGRVWAVEVSATSLAIASYDGARLYTFAEEPLPVGVWERGVVTDPDQLGERLGRLLGKFGRRGGKVRFVVPNVDAIERLLTIPLVPKGKIALAVEAEVRRQLAVDLEQVYLRWTRVGSSAGHAGGDGPVGSAGTVGPAGQHGHVVYLALVLRDALDSYLAALRKAKYEPFYADLESLAVLRGVGKREGFFVTLSGGFLAVTGADDGVPFFSYGQTVEGLAEVAAIEQALATGGSALRGSGKVTGFLPIHLFGEAARPEIAAVLQERGYPVQEFTAAVPCPPDFPVARRAALLGALLA